MGISRQSLIILLCFSVALFLWTYLVRSTYSNGKKSIINEKLYGTRKNELCKGPGAMPSLHSCRSARKLRILVVDWGIVDRHTGAANRHLEILSSLGMLGHMIMRGAIRARHSNVSNMDSVTQQVFRGMQIDQVEKKLHYYPTNSVEEYKHTLKAFDPDVVFLTLWFCGGTVNETTPGYLLDAHRATGHRAKIVVESSDVHAVRLDMLQRIEAEAAAGISATARIGRKGMGAAVTMPGTAEMRRIEAALYGAADAVVAISHEDQQRMLDMSPRANVHVVRYAHVHTEPLPSLPSQPSSGGGGSAGGGLAHAMATATWAEREGLVFVGGGSTVTNRVAMEWFVSHVWPQLWNFTSSSQPLTLSVVGQWRVKRSHPQQGSGHRNASARLPASQPHPHRQTQLLNQAIACSHWQFIRRRPFRKNSKCHGMLSHIHFMGRLSDDELASKLNRSRVFISPIVFSTGVNTKHVLALERVIPLVTTSAGTGGLCLFSDMRTLSPSSSALQFPSSAVNTCNGGGDAARRGEGSRSHPFIVADEPTAFTAATKRVYTDEQHWLRTAQLGQQHARTLLTLKLAAQDMDALLYKLNLFQ